MPSAEIIALASLVLNIIVALAGLTWGIRRIGSEIERKIDAHRDRQDTQIDQVARDAGQVGAALRSKITEVELFIRDNFVRNDSFYESMRGYGTEMRSQFEKIEARLERMEGKIDTKN